MQIILHFDVKPVQKISGLGCILYGSIKLVPVWKNVKNDNFNIKYNKPSKIEFHSKLKRHSSKINFLFFYEKINFFNKSFLLISSDIIFMKKFLLSINRKYLKNILLKKYPQIDIILPTYNRSEMLLKRSIPSVLNQTYKILNLLSLVINAQITPRKLLRVLLTSGYILKI